MTPQEIKDHINTIVTDSTGFITADEIYSTLTNQVDPGRTQETIRKYIREMVNTGEYLIGSSNNGYFKITNRVQALKAIQYLESRIPDLQARVNRIRQNWNHNNPANTI
jgi:hypothetical protein